MVAPERAGPLNVPVLTVRTPTVGTSAPTSPRAAGLARARDGEVAYVGAVRAPGHSAIGDPEPGGPLARQVEHVPRPPPDEPRRDASDVQANCVEPRDVPSGVRRRAGKDPRERATPGDARAAHAHEPLGIAVAGIDEGGADLPAAAVPDPREGQAAPRREVEAQRAGLEPEDIAAGDADRRRGIRADPRPRREEAGRRLPLRGTGASVGGGEPRAVLETRGEVDDRVADREEARDLSGGDVRWRGGAGPDGAAGSKGPQRRHPARRPGWRTSRSRRPPRWAG